MEYVDGQAELNMGNRNIICNQFEINTMHYVMWNIGDVKTNHIYYWFRFTNCEENKGMHFVILL